MKIRFLDVEGGKRSKAAERAADKAAERLGQAAERQKRNSFIPDARGWTIDEVPDPQQGEELD